MARIKKNRLVQRSPSFNGFIPVNAQHPNRDAVELTFEEYEAFTLCDYEGLNHVEAAALMEVSRPTFTRIYSSARKKLAIALVEACPVGFTEGNSVIANQWYHCSACQIDFSGDTKSSLACPFCSSVDIVKTQSL